MTAFSNRYLRIIIFFVAVAAFFWLVWILRTVVLPFALGLIAAYLIYPFLCWMERRLPRLGSSKRVRRVVLILLIYLIIMAILGIAGYFTMPMIIQSIGDLFSSLPAIISGAMKTIRNHVPLGMQSQFDTYLARGLNALGQWVERGITNTLLSLPSRIATVMAFISLPVFIFYVLKDADSIAAGLYASLSEWSAEQVRSVLRILNDVMGRYVRTQTIMSVVLGIMALVALEILRIPYAPALAIWAGIVEFVPLVGTWIGGATAVIVALATIPEHALWVAVAFGAIRMTEDTLLAPRIAGQLFRIHPALILVLIVAFGRLAGFWGVIVALPVSATIIQLYHYVMRATKKEEL